MEHGPSNAMLVDALFRHLSNELGESVSLGTTGACTLEFDGDVSVTIEVPEGSEVLHVYSNIDRCPTDRRSEFIEEALSLNLFGTQTGGAALALDQASNNVILCLSQPIELLDEHRLVAIVAGFVDMVPDLRQRLQAIANNEARHHGDEMPSRPNIIVA